jgi:hypothetical protein
MTRKYLTADRTYYVRADGCDENNGRSYTPSGAFRTLQHASDYIRDTLDLAGRSACVRVGPGTYDAGVVASGPFTGAAGPGAVTFEAVDGFSSAVIDCVGAAFTAQHGASIFVRGGFKLKGRAFGLTAIHGGKILAGAGLNFGECGVHVYATRFGYVELAGDYAIFGGATNHLQASHSGNSRVQGCTASFGAACRFDDFAFCLAQADLCYTNGAAINLNAQSVTGRRFNVVENGVIQWSGGGPNSFPGSVAGVESSGGRYVHQ